MSHTYTQLLYHVIFSTRNRENLIDPELRDHLYPYITGIVRSERGSLLAIGGIPDHVHLLVQAKPSLSLSDLMRIVKANSSRWISERDHRLSEFSWQEGYGAFSVSHSSAAAICRYIQDQEAHHRRRTYEEEWIKLLKRHRIDFDPAHPFA